MFDSLNLDGVTEVSAVVWGAVVALVKLSFRCACSVDGYQHAGGFLVTAGRPCYAHGPTGREPITARLAHPCALERSQAAAWVEGFQDGYRRAMGWTRTECDAFAPDGNGGWKPRDGIGGMERGE